MKISICVLTYNHQNWITCCLDGILQQEGEFDYEVILFDDCSEEMQAEYLSRSVLPEKFHTKCGKSVQQIDPKTGNIIEVFHSNREVIKKFQISSITLRKISDTDIIHNGYKWRVIENA